jgi:hypothetical protein
MSYLLWGSASGSAQRGHHVAAMITPPGKDRKYKSASSGTELGRRALEVSGTTTATEIDSSTPQRSMCGEESQFTFAAKNLSASSAEISVCEHSY